MAKHSEFRNLALLRYQIKVKNHTNCLNKTGDDHNSQKLNFDFTFHAKMIIKFMSQGKTLDHDSLELNFCFHVSW